MNSQQAGGLAATVQSDLLLHKTLAVQSGPKGGLGYNKGGLSGGLSHLNSEDFDHPGSPTIFLDQF